MKKTFTFCFLFLTFHNLFGQNCNLEFGVKIDYNNKRLTDNYSFSFCEGISITLIADEITNASYQWFLDDKEIKGATKINYSVGDVGGKYTIKAVLGSCSYSRNVTINFTKYFGAFIYIGSKVNICEKNGEVKLFTYPYPEDNLNINGKWIKLIFKEL
jgi:hypothetical protein